MLHIPTSASPFVPASHENPDRPGVWKRVIATRTEFQPGQIQMLNWARLPGGSSFQPHYHEDMQEVFVLLSGRVTMDAGSESVEMVPGDCVIIGPREVHRMTNLTSDEAEYLVFGISSGAGGRTIVVPEP